MKDVFGYNLEIGDVVAFTEPNYTYRLMVGTISRFTEKMVVVAWQDLRMRTDDKTKYTRKFPIQLAKKVSK